MTKLSNLGNSLVYSTYLGVCSHGYAIAVDPAGEAYVTGGSADILFPTTANAFQTSCGGPGGSAFLTKLTAQGDDLIYSTCLGSNLGGEPYGEAGGHGVALDSTGNAYIAGSASFIGTGVSNFPTTAGAFQSQPVVTGGAFVAVLNPSASGTSSLIYSTFLSGHPHPRFFNGDQGFGIAVDSFGMVYVTGFAGSPDFPVTPGAFLTTYPAAGGNQGYNSFITKFNATGTDLIYSSYLGGGNHDDVANGIAVDSAGDAYVTGHTQSLDFSVTQFASQPLYGGSGDAFVTKFPVGSPAGLSVTGILPNRGGNAGQVTATIIGAGFHNGASVKLVGSRETIGQSVTVGPEGRTITTTFDLNGVAPGPKNLVVKNPDGTIATLSQGFTVQQGGAPDIRIHKIGTTAVPGRNVSYYTTVQNVGNIDSTDSFVSESLQQEFSLISASPLPITDDPMLPANQFILWSVPRLSAREVKIFF